jgi:hypothetical protein
MHGIAKRKLRMFSKERGFAGWFDTSAKQNINIDKAARFLVDQILLHKDIFVQKKASQVHWFVKFDNERC